MIDEAAKALAIEFCRQCGADPFELITVEKFVQTDPRGAGYPLREAVEMWTKHYDDARIRLAWDRAIAATP